MERREQWTYIETKHAAKIDCGEFELRPGWNGTLDADELRELLQRAVTEHNQHAQLVEQRDRLLRLLRPVTSPTACYCAVMKDEKCWHCEARELIATVEQGDETQAKGGSESESED